MNQPQNATETLELSNNCIREICGFKDKQLLIVTEENLLIAWSWGVNNSEKSTQKLERPIKDLLQFNNFVIATQTDNKDQAQLVRLCRHNKDQFYQEKSFIKCCDTILGHDEDTNECLGFNSVKEYFVKFKIQEPKERYVQEVEYDMVEKLWYVNLTNTPHFNGILGK